MLMMLGQKVKPLSALFALEQRCGIVTVSAVRKQCHDRLAFIFRTLCKLQCCGKCRTGGNTGQDTFLLRKQLRCLKCVVICDLDDLIVNLGIQGIRYKACADSLDLVRACLALGKYRRSLRLYCYYLYLRLLGLQILTGAAQCSARTYACDKDIYLSVGIISRSPVRSSLCEPSDSPGSQTVPG